MTTWQHPYHDLRGVWLRGSLHGHSSEISGCASVPLRQGARQYHEVGARVMAVTDHDHVTDLSALRSAYPDMVFLEGFEYSTSENFLVIGEHVPPLYTLSPPEVLARAEALLTIIAHPHPRPAQTYWTREKILALGRLPDGIEVYNGHYGTAMLRSWGCAPLYTHVWDELLTAGLRVWGFADDDFHDPLDFGNAFNMFLVEDATPVAVLRAAKHGRCYASTGLLLADFHEETGRLTVTLATPATGRFIGPGGQVLAEDTGTHFAYTATDEVYVRFEAEGPAGRLFLQPMWRGVA